MASCCLFDTNFGVSGLLWEATALLRIQMPEQSRAKTLRKLTAGLRGCQELPLEKAPAWVQDTVGRLQRFLSHGDADLSTLPLDLSHASPFLDRVYRATQNIPRGETLSYGALAQLVGSPGAARAVGQAMSRNPLPLAIPCHRVVAAGGKWGGFSASAGVVTKQQLLALEQAASLDWKQHFSEASSKILPYLKQQDPILGAWIEQLGSCGLQPERGHSVFAALTRAIIYQQLHGKAAATILKRLMDLFPDRDFPGPEALLQRSEADLLGVGLSRNKLRSIQDLATQVLAQRIPSFEELDTWSDAQIVERLCLVRGIGPWTAEMLLIFNLGRRDVLPVSDLGVRKGYQKLFRKREMPSADQLLRHGEAWRPFRSIVAWYLWRAAEA
jgi:O-6-methylguanine DNA methyltransferase